MLKRTYYKNRIYIASIYKLIEFTKSLPLHDLRINGAKRLYCNNMDPRSELFSSKSTPHDYQALK